MAVDLCLLDLSFSDSCIFYMAALFSPYTLNENASFGPGWLN